MRGLQIHRRRDTGVQGFQPAVDAKAPPVAVRKSTEAVFGPGRHQIIATLQRKHEEFLSYFAAHHMGAVVMGIGIAASVTQKTGQRIERTGLQRSA